jgi:hypothetical protein
MIDTLTRTVIKPVTQSKLKAGAQAKALSKPKGQKPCE